MSTRTSDRPRLPVEARVLAPRVTRTASIVVVVGVFVQAALAGGFLAGHSALTDVHMAVGIPLVVSGLALVGIGLFGRRSRREPRRVLLARIGVLTSLLGTAILGILSGAGTRDLLVIHIPLAIVGMVLAVRLVGWADPRAGSATTLSGLGPDS